jgi:hypothetical protein
MAARENWEFALFDGKEYRHAVWLVRSCKLFIGVPVWSTFPKIFFSLLNHSHRPGESH